MVGRSRRNTGGISVWPGYVDALSALLMLVIFMLLIYMVTQLFLSQTLSDRDEELSRLNNRLAEISQLLRLEEERTAALESELSSLQSAYDISLSRGDLLETEVDRLQDRVEADREQIEVLLGTQASLQQDIVTLRELRDQLEAEIGDLAAALAARDDDVEELEDELADAQTELGALRDRRQVLEAQLADEQERTFLAQREIDEQDIRIEDLMALVDEGEQAIEEERTLSASQRAQINRLNDQISALQDQLQAISAALRLQESVTEARDVEIAELGQRLNTLLAERVDELERYQSEFFGRLRELLEDREDIRIEGDRFLLPSELFFASGSANIGAAGEPELDTLADLLLELNETIPDDIEWILRVDGHTDRVPISTAQFSSNWELSTARAVSVVEYLVEQGVPPERLAATGFGEFQPIDEADTPEAYQRNRRIEIKVTSQ